MDDYAIIVKENKKIKEALQESVFNDDNTY